MALKIRTVAVEEFDDLMALLERCFGHSKDFFIRQYPHLYRTDAEACSYGHVIEKHGKIVSHIGIYPIETVIAGIQMRIAGIGGVATAPEERGRNHMSRLLKHVTNVIREQGYSVSGLGGDRQRYNAYGWETAGMTYTLRFTRRSLAARPGKVVRLEEKRAVDAFRSVEEFHTLAECHSRRPHLATQLGKQKLRFLTARDGYIIGCGEPWDAFSILELVSASGQEAAMIASALELARCGEVRWTVSMWEQQALSRVMNVAAGWSAGSDWDYKIVDLGKLLETHLSTITERAKGLKDFEASIGFREPDRVQNVTMRLRRGEFELVPSRRSKVHIELDRLAAARLILGGLPSAEPAAIPLQLKRLFPLPMHVLALDHV